MFQSFIKQNKMQQQTKKKHPNSIHRPTSHRIQNQSQISAPSQQSQINRQKNQSNLLHDPLNQSRKNFMGTHSNPQLNQLRKTNLIKVLSSKSPEERSQKENNIIIESLKYEPFFQPVLGNIKLIGQIASKLKYRLVKEGQLIMEVKQTKSKDEDYFVLIRGQVEVFCLQKIIKDAENESFNNVHIGSQGVYFQKIHLKNPNKNKSDDKNHQNKSQPQIIDLTQDNETGKIKNDLFDDGFLKLQSNLDCGEQNVQQFGMHKDSFHQIDSNMALQQFWSPTQIIQPPITDNGEDEIELIKIEKKPMQRVQENIQSKQEYQIRQKIIKTIEQGQCFGLSTLKDLIEQQFSWIIVRPVVTCHLICLTKQHYQQIITASKNNEIKKLQDFLSSLELFNFFYRYSIQGFIHSMTQITCQYKTTLFKQGEDVNFVFIIKSGDYSLSKIVDPSKKDNSLDSRKPFVGQEDQIISLRRQQSNFREGRIKSITQGEIVGDCEAYLRVEKYHETCRCVSESGIVFRIDKRLFLQKLLSPENEVAQIRKHLNSRYNIKLKQIQEFLNRQLNNQTIARLWPASKSCDRKLKATKPMQRIFTAVKRYSDSLYQSQMNFFDQLNRTIPKNKQKRRINYKVTQNLSKQRSIYSATEMKRRCKTSIDESFSKFQQDKLAQTERQKMKSTNKFGKQKQKQKPYNVQAVNLQQTPASIKDIVGMVNCKQQYYKARNKKTETGPHVSFQFQTQKLPRYIEQKYKHLLMRLKAK